MTTIHMDSFTLLLGLVQYNYFPCQKMDNEELPNVITSIGINNIVNEEINKLNPRRKGYDQVEYRVTRFNNVPRIFNIPHPLPYIKLCNELKDNWHEFADIAESENSIIKPQYYADGRIFIMDYESSKIQLEKHIGKSFNNKFFVHTDISNCFPSIYSHAIPWALVGIDMAKSTIGEDTFYNRIDKYTRVINRCETNGVPIGPGASNVLSEIILSKIDKTMVNYGFDFIRYIDDYRAYFPKFEKAEEFIRRLSEELTKYKLILNIKKTKIAELPLPSSDDWIVDLNSRKPKTTDNVMDIIRFLDYALLKQSGKVEGSILKYATKVIINDLNENNISMVLNYLLGLCSKYPVLIPVLSNQITKISNNEKKKYSNLLCDILKEQILNRRSDSVTWILYYLIILEAKIPNNLAEEIIKSRDCLPILLLYKSNQYQDEITNFCNDCIINNNINYPDYLIDNYWILLYQLFYDDVISNPYINHGDDKKAFEILKTHHVELVQI